MKRVLLLFTFIALVLAGVASADREPGSCCPAGEAGKMQMQGHSEAHHPAGRCCGPRAESTGDRMCMRGETGEKGCCAPRAEGEQKGCCGDATCAKHENGQAGCCEKKAEGQGKGCCAKAGAHGGQS
jgi:hypothetical protein